MPTLRLRPSQLDRLENLTKRITPRNVHEELAFGRPMGREAL